VLDGSRLVGTGTLSGGKVTVSVRTNLAVGVHTLTVSYGGDGAFAGSKTTVKVTVVRATSTTTVTAPSARATTAATVTAKVRAATGVPTTGKVTFVVSKGGKVVATRVGTLTTAGQAKVTLPRLAAGTYTVKATYAGSTSVAGSSATASLVVRP